MSALGSDHLLTRPQKIQFILRQTVYYLHETKASSSALRPPEVGSISTPFASTLPLSTSASHPDQQAGSSHQHAAVGKAVELGLYGRRMEVSVLEDVVDALRRIRRGREEGKEIDGNMEDMEGVENGKVVDVDSGGDRQSIPPDDYDRTASPG
jgi:hypothetical protein